MQSDKPFHYLTQEQFLALQPEERIAYLQRVTDHLAFRAALMEERQKREPGKKS